MPALRLACVGRSGSDHAMRYQFANCELDVLRHEFTCNKEVVALEPQVLDLLTLFVRNPDTLISRDRIIDEVWHGRIVSEAAVSSRINALRRAIGDSGKAQTLLRTIPRRGFRFVAKVTASDEATPAPTSAAQQAIRLTVSRDKARIAYAQTGAGLPLLRAGHFLTHLEHDWKSPVWRPLLDRLNARFTLTRYDQRGTGLSDPNPPSFKLERLVDDLEAVADVAGLEKFPIFAASQGVPVAIAFSIRHPERVSKMVLYGGFAQGRSIRGGDGDMQQAEAIATIIRHGWGKAGSAFATAFATLYMPDGTTEQLQHMTKMQLASATPENALALRSAIDCYDVLGLLPQVSVPTLILHANEDSVHPVAQASTLAAHIPAAQMRILDSRNHIPLPQDPCWEEMLDAVEGFLA